MSIGVMNKSRFRSHVGLEPTRYLVVKLFKTIPPIATEYRRKENAEQSMSVASNAVMFTRSASGEWLFHSKVST